ncbi:hypothetical protein OB955_07535 [Halobacteria archaeon AArc-m2/3/4]|uniref:Uncharacterized protein n=1 Tax=Natronoglomus mannanivorans TaxID=2979990 RepID=A0AAP2YXF6_9EURY|nr:hypothetical protein [Halobacteria archaeon AArc-xg1-1]MCU4972590.1 hypothetical protein [Halobacteria archaeon AArc-m2/3/4]
MAVVDTALIFAVSLVVGTIGILAGARLVVDSDAGVPNAAFTALVGAAVWAATSFLVDWIGLVDWAPILGVALMLVAWIGIINWRYPGNWGSAIAIGFLAWVVAVAIVYVLSMFGIVAPEALGIPGA